MAAKPTEPVVTDRKDLPRNYRFLAKGNVYLTANCRRRTQEGGQIVFVVHSPHPRLKKDLLRGIGIPAAIYREVKCDEEATRSTRAAAVKRRDDAAARDFEISLRRQYPKIPRDVISELVRHATTKYSGRVGRTSLLNLDSRVRLAVTAHIRHRHTEYDQLLRDGSNREHARATVWKKSGELENKWAGRSPKLSIHRTHNGRSTRRASIESGRKTRAILDSETPIKKPVKDSRSAKATTLVKAPRRKRGAAHSKASKSTEDAPATKKKPLKQIRRQQRHRGRGA